MESKKELDYIYYMKAMCIVMVLLIHSISWGNKYYDAYSSLSETIWFFCYNTSRPLFFIISGYLCHKQEVKSYFIKKIKTLLVPFWVFSSIKLIYSIFVDNQYAHANTIVLQLYDAFILGRLYWFPYTIFIICSIMPLFWVDESNKQLEKKPYRLIIFFVIVLIINSYLSITGIKYDDSIIPFELSDVLYFLPYFMLGYLMKYKTKSIYEIIDKKQNHLIIYFLIIVITMLLINAFVSELSNYLIKFIFCICSSYCLYILALRIENKKWLKLIGKYTWQIHFLDPFVKVILFTIIGKLGTINLLLIVITALLDTIISLFLCIIIDKIPLIRKYIGLQ